MAQNFNIKSNPAAKGAASGMPNDKKVLDRNLPKAGGNNSPFYNGSQVGQGKNPDTGKDIIPRG
jgi:hypothetical protein